MIVRPSVKQILVVGHPRSGTGFMSRLLQAYGLAVGHEQVDEDGISSWMFAATTTEVPFSFDGSSRANYIFQTMIHVVRHPLGVIASTAYTELVNPPVIEYLSRFVVVDRFAEKLEQACQSYLGWNKLIEAQRPDLRVRVEEAPELIAEFLQKRGLYRPPICPPVLPPTDYNSREHPQITAAQLRDIISQGLWAELVDYTEELGYARFEA